MSITKKQIPLLRKHLYTASAIRMERIDMKRFFTWNRSECMLAGILEVAMLLSFGAAWPASILKSWHSRTAKGKSIAFLLIITLGYLCGIGAKIAGGNVNYIVFFYVLNTLAVTTDIALYCRNRRLDGIASSPIN